MSILKAEYTNGENNVEKTTANTQYGNEVGNSLLHSYESIIRFKINPDEVKDTNKCLESSEFKLNELTWKVRVCKKTVEEKKGESKVDVEYASVELESVFNDDTAAWSCEAKAAVTLIAKKEEGKDKKDMTGEISIFTYSKLKPLSRNEKFIKWAELKEYLDDGNAKFDFNVVTKSLDRSSRLEQTTAKFQLRVKQVKDLKNEYSNELIVRGIKWKILTSQSNGYLAIFVMANENDIDTDANWVVSTKVKLTSTKTDKDLERKFTNKPFSWTRTDLGFRKFLEWSEFTKAENGYVQNNAALLEIELSVNPK